MDLREIRPKAIKRGAFLGLILLIIGIISLYIIANTTSLWLVILSPIIFSFIIPVAVATFFSSNLRKHIGGYWNFRQATTSIFLMFIMAYIVSSLGNYGFGKFIAPGMDEKVKKNLITASTSAMENQGMDQEMIDEKVADIEKQFEKRNLTIGGIIQGTIFSIIIVFVFALIFAAIFKKEPPLYTKPGETPPSG